MVNVNMKPFHLLRILCLCVILTGISAIELLNVALNRPTHHHPGTHQTHVSGLAVNGDRNTTVDYCSHTFCPVLPPCSTQPQWWVVDLQGFYVIRAVVITNRADDVGTRLRNFYLEVYSENPVAVVSAKPASCFYQQKPVEDGATVRFNCTQPARGRYLKVNKMTSQEPLQLCEVEVLADLDNAVRRFARLEGQKAAGDVIKETTAGSVLSCASECAKVPGCTAFDLGPEVVRGDGSRPCRLLLFGGLLQNTSFTVTTRGWNFWNLE